MYKSKVDQLFLNIKIIEKKLIVEEHLPSRFEELDALRGIAALMVVIFHLTMGREEAELGFKIGTTGVDLFFIISGFVISISIGKVSNATEFVINRIARLFPTYWAAVTFTFTIITVYGFIKSEPIRWIDYAGNMTMFQYYMNIPNLDGPYWTLIIEMLFYIFMVLLFKTKLLSHILLVGSFFTISIVISSLFFWGFQTRSVFIFIPLLEFFPLFFTGILFYKIKTGTKHFYHYLLLVMCLVSQILLFDHAGGSKSFINQTEYAVALSVYFSSFLLFVHNKLSFISKRPFLFLGKISFALYLTHLYLINGHVLPLLINRLEINFWISSLLVCLPVSIAVATAITYWIEIPLGAKMKSALTNVFLKTQMSIL